jgi:hypothetical protein
MIQVAKSHSVQSEDQKCGIHFELLLEGAELDIVFMLTCGGRISAILFKNRLVFCRQMFLKYLTCLAKSAHNPAWPLAKLEIHTIMRIFFELVRD